MWYQEENDCLIDDYRFKFVFNFTGQKKIKSHFSKRSAFAVLDYKDLVKLANKPPSTPLEDLLTKALSYAR